MHSIGARLCLDKVVKAMNQDNNHEHEQWPWKRGKGLAVGNKYCMPGGVSVGLVKILEDGTLEVHHGADNFGQGSNTVMAQIAAEVFNLAVDKVKVIWGDTDQVPFTTGTISQGSTYNVGNGVRLAAIDAKRKMLIIAAEKMGVPPDDLDTRDGTIYVKSSPSIAIDIADVFTKISIGSYVRSEGEIVGRDTWVQNSAPPDPETGQIDHTIAQKGLRRASFYGYAAQGAEVLVNTETGEMKVVKLVSACDMGQPINPKMCEGQIEGSMAMSLGSALLEEMIIDNGKVLNPNWRDYKIPTSWNVPDQGNIKEYFTSVPHKEGPYGAKGMGETVITTGAPAIGNAIYDAVGVRIKDIPINAEKLLLELKKATKE
jgi:CO/xanthine dehydrogenase Mo-binding subunit